MEFLEEICPVRLVKNNIGAPGYNMAKFWSQTLEANLKILNRYIVKNNQVTQNLLAFKVTAGARQVAFDIKDPSVNFPT